jgi:hypothetical protein
VLGGQTESFRSRPGLEESESLLELTIGGLKRGLRIDVQLAPHVGEREQKITQLFGGVASISPSHGLLELAPLLLHLREQTLAVRPVESDARGLGGDPQCFQEGGKRRRDP